MIRLCTIVVILLCFVTASAQEDYIFRQGLVIGNCHEYGRQAVNTDLFAYHYYSEGYKTPKAGTAVFSDSEGKVVSWKEIKADSAGLFTGKDASNGYIYLTYNSAREQTALVNITGNAMFYLNSEPHAGDPYAYNWLYIPVKLRKGLNEFYVRTSRITFQGMKAMLVFPEKPVFINVKDATLPYIVMGHDNTSLLGAVVIVNATAKQVDGLSVKAVLQGKEIVTESPSVMPYSIRKVAFRFDGSGVSKKGKAICSLSLISKGKIIAASDINIESVRPEEPYKITFISSIDGTVQYYAVNPQKEGSNSKALVLSVHGAEVEAINQARAYKPKDWCVLVAPTNRRPRGFNWEDWGRLDALEVLSDAVKRFNPDPSKIYLTGHSMGGHGTWFLGATYPGKWAAIAPCAGYPTLLGYGSADGKIPQPMENSMEQTILRAGNGSNVLELAGNYAAGGVYVFHGDADSTVPVRFARQMRQVLGTFHNDFCYYEYPGGSHWWSDESVDWDPLFNYLKWHTIMPDSSITNIDFTTANPAVSSGLRWASIIQQKESLKYSRIKLHLDKKNALITGNTENAAMLKLDVTGIEGEMVNVEIDGDQLRLKKPAEGMLWLVNENKWKESIAPGGDTKGIVRNGTFKEPFNNRMVFVYGTTGTKDENEWSLAKARYDAETWYIRANGAVDIIADRNFSPSDFPDRGIIIYGNSTTNAAWKLVLAECPIQVSRGSILVGSERISGSNYGAYIMYPRKDSKTASVSAISGTGPEGMHAAGANQYFAGGSGFPDYMIFSSGMLEKGVEGVVRAGYYGNNWDLTNR
jgi:poly(3-hydroxybutyrate) depolymerase